MSDLISDSTNDLISRQAAIDALSCENPTEPYIDYDDAVKAIRRLPSVQLERKPGRWIPMKVSSGRDSWKCSVCGRRARGKLENLPYCHCGAKMEKQNEENAE